MVRAGKEGKAATAGYSWAGVEDSHLNAACLSCWRIWWKDNDEVPCQCWTWVHTNRMDDEVCCLGKLGELCHHYLVGLLLCDLLRCGVGWGCACFTFLGHSACLIDPSIDASAKSQQVHSEFAGRMLHVTGFGDYFFHPVEDGCCQVQCSTVFQPLGHLIRIWCDSADYLSFSCQLHLHCFLGDCQECVWEVDLVHGPYHCL